MSTLQSKLTQTNREEAFVASTKLSEIMRHALFDLELVKADPRYKVDMGQWHYPVKKCYVCFAGAVMAKSMGCDIKEYCTPSSLLVQNKLLALDSIRAGFVSSALTWFGSEGYDKEQLKEALCSNGLCLKFEDSEDVFLDIYKWGEYANKTWTAQMYKIVHALEECGL